MFAARSYKNYGASNDPYFNNTSLLLHGDGTNGAQNNTFLDSGPNNFTITRNGTPTQGSFSPFPLNGVAYNPLVHGGSGYFDGVDDFLSVSDNLAFEIPTQNFTIEYFVYFNSLPALNVDCNIVQKGLVVNSNYEYTFGLRNRSGTPELVFSYSLDGTTAIAAVVSPAVITTGVWYHFAVTRSGTNIQLWVNGILSATSTSYPATTFSGTGTFSVGSNPSGNFELNGFVSNVRLVKGTVVYTSNFTPPTEPLTSITNTSILLNFTNTGILDNTAKNDLITVGNAQISTSIKKYGTGSIVFDGTGDELIIPQNASFQFGTGGFTIECWVYCTNLAGGTSGKMEIIDFRSSTISEVRPTIEISGGTFLYFTAGANRISSGSISANTWYHVAVSRVSGTTRMFVNGTKVGVDYVDSNSYLISAPIIGSAGNWISGYDFVGYMDDIRITKGVGRYAANFTPPQQAFPNL